MPRILELPDGRELELPDNMSGQQREQLRVRLAEQFPDFQPSSPQAPAAEPTPEESVDTGFLSRFRTNFGRGLQRLGAGAKAIATNEELPNGRTGREQGLRNLEGLVRSATGPVGGDFVAAGTARLANIATGQGTGGNELAEQRARREQLESENRLGTLAAKGVTGVAAARSLITRAPALNAANATTRTGKATALAAEGGILAGTARAAEGGTAGEVATATGTGAALSPLVTAGVGGTGALVRNLTERGTAAVQRLAGRGGEISDKAIRSISSRIGLSENQVRDAITARTAATGRPISVAEALQEGELEKFVTLSQNREAAAAVFREAQEAALDARPETLGRSILGREGAPVSQQEQFVATGEAFTAAKQLINDVEVPPTIISTLDGVDEVRGALGGTLFRKLGEVQDGARPLTVELADDIREALRGASRAADTPSGSRRVLANLGNEVELGLRQSSDFYDEAFQNFTRGRRFDEGLEVGRGANTPTRQDLEFDQTRVRTRAEQGGDPENQTFGGVSQADAIASRQAGISEGRTVDLVDRATRSPSSALRVADELTTSDSAARTTITQNADEAERLSALGRAETGAQRNLDALAQRTAKTDELAQTARELFTIPAAASGRFSGGFGVEAGVRFLKERLRPLGISDNAAEEVAKALTSNNQAVINQVLDRLRARGVTDEIIVEIGQDLQAAIAVNAGSGTES